MAVTAANVLVGKPLTTGGVLVAPLLTALPTNSTTALNVAFTAVGYISDDGVTQSIDTDHSEIKAWGGDIVRIVQTKHAVSYKFTIIETNTASLGVYYGTANVVDTSGVVAVTVKGGELDHQEWVLEIRDGVKSVRVVIPDGNVTDRGDISYKDDEAIAYEVTVTANPNATGIKAYIYSA